MTPRKVAQLLRSYDIKPKTIRLGDKVANGYEKSHFAEPWERYLVDDDEPEPIVASLPSAAEVPF